MKLSIILKIIMVTIIIIILAMIAGICYGTYRVTGPIAAICTACLLVIMIIIFSIWFCRKARKEMYKVREPEIHEHLYNIMEYFDKLCTENNISYCACGGTALGILRHKRIIPWDDDIDCFMLESDLKRLQNLKNKYTHHGYEVVKFRNGLWRFQNKHVFIDLLLIKKIKGDKYTFVESWARSMWPTEWLYSHELYPLKRYKFGKLKILGPAKIKKYVVRTYGSGWKIPKITHTHTPTPYNIARSFYSNLGLI